MRGAGEVLGGVDRHFSTRPWQPLPLELPSRFRTPHRRGASFLRENRLRRHS